jgi:biotin transport system substrate-specific component
VTITALFATLTAIGALITIPLSPVPITLQTFFTYLAGAILGSYLGALSQIIYLLLGGMGLPVFAGSKAGFGVLVGPTGGYLLGFVAGAFVIGKLVEIKDNPGFAWILISMSIGTLAIYLFGVIQLSIWMRISIYQSISFGVLPFLIGDSLKMLTASFVTLKVRYRMKKLLTTFG